MDGKYPVPIIVWRENDPIEVPLYGIRRGDELIIVTNDEARTIVARLSELMKEDADE